MNNIGLVSVPSNPEKCPKHARRCCRSSQLLTLYHNLRFILLYVLTTAHRPDAYTKRKEHPYSQYLDMSHKIKVNIHIRARWINLSTTRASQRCWIFQFEICKFDAHQPVTRSRIRRNALKHACNSWAWQCSAIMCPVPVGLIIVHRIKIVSFSYIAWVCGSVYPKSLRKVYGTALLMWFVCHRINVCLTHQLGRRRFWDSVFVEHM
jgi:hypothetical protein